MRARAVVLGVLAGACLTGAGLSACSGGGAAPDATGRTAAEQLAAAKLKVDGATAMHLTLRSTGIPKDANGVIGADGAGTRAPAFKGTFDARIAGLQAKVDVVAVGGVLYLKLPFTMDYAPTDPKTYNAPDPAALFATTGGISSLLPATTGPTFGGKTRAGAEVLQTITGTLPGNRVVDLLMAGDRSKTFDVTYGISDPGDELRTAALTGPFFGTASSTYTLTLDRYGEPVEIRKP